MIKVPFVVNGQDMAPVTLTFRVTHEVTYERVVTTMTGSEHTFGRRLRPIIEFTVMLSREASGEDYRALLREPMTVEYGDPDAGLLELPFRLDCNLEKQLECWNCVDNFNYYSSGTIRLRCKEVLPDAAVI